MGRADESFREAKRALELDPVSVGANHTATAMYYMARQYDQAIEQARRRIEIDPNNSSAYYWLFQCCWGKDQLDEAIAAWQKCMILRGESAQAVAAMRHAYEVGGIRAYWRWRVAHDRSARQVNLWAVALWSAQARQIDQALQWLEKAYEQRDAGLTLLRVEPFLDPIRSDPRFQDLVRRMSFPP